MTAEFARGEATQEQILGAAMGGRRAQLTMTASADHRSDFSFRSPFRAGASRRWSASYALGLVFNADGAFFKWDTHRDMLRQVSVFGILACGMTLVIIAGGIDLVGGQRAGACRRCCSRC